jgi:transmembrane sensor
MDHPGTEEFNELLKRYLQESLNPQELALFFELAARPDNSQLVASSFRKDLDDGLPDLSGSVQKQEAWTKLLAKTEANRPPVRQMRVALRWVAVLICLVCAAVTVYLFNRSKNRTELVQTKSDIKTPSWLGPEHIGATLFLSGGDSIALNNQDKGIIAVEDGVHVLQSGGAIRYSGNSQKRMYHEIRTGRGKLWRAILPDQTVVWLNGGSSIRYPLQFDARARSVEITGEVYFEVAHHADYPFRVKTGGLLIEDIGTSFNIKAFADDPAVTATLVEGLVRVTMNSQQATVSAGQQSVVSPHSNEIRIVQNANLTEALAWKNGFFYFEKSALRDVMKQLSDWYQVDVIYKGSGSKELFSGQIDKTLSLPDVLQGLQQPGVKFNLDSNHQITVIQQ